MPLVFRLIRETAWKLGDRACVFADWDGFCEIAVPGEYPGGCLRWLARGLTTLGMTPLWWVPYLLSGVLLGLALRALFGWGRRVVWMVVGLIVSFGPLLLVGWDAWMEREPSYLVFHALGLAVVCGLLALFRGRMRRMFSLLGLPVTVALFVMVGAAALLFGVGWCLHLVRGCRGKVSRWIVPTMAFLAVVFVPSFVCRGLYDGLDPTLGLFESCGFRLYHECVPALARHVKMERLVHAADWSEVERTAARGGDFPLRMEIAYRILAQYRTGSILENLFTCPIRTNHAATDAHERQLDGYLLLFNYGFLLPARREIYERMLDSGLEPNHLRYLGDIAFVRGEFELARRDYLQLARCPFRGRFAAARLKALDAANAAGAEDLRPIAEMALYWSKFFKSNGETFVSMDERVEDFIYTRFRLLREASPEMVRMTLAAALLSGDVKKVTENFHLLDHFCPAPRSWPKAVQEGLVSYLRQQPDAERERISRLIRSDAILPSTDVRYGEFLAARQTARSQQAQDVFRRRFGDTYWFYAWWALGQK